MANDANKIYYLFNDDLANNPSAFDELYKTADILISKKDEATNFLKYADNEDKFKLFRLVDDIGGDNTNFYSWRNYKNSYERNLNNGNIDSIFKVSKKIKLYLDNTNIPTGYSYDLGKISDLTKSGAFSALQNVAEGVAQFNAVKESLTDPNQNGGNINYQTRINPLKNVPYFQNLSTSIIDNLSFTFSWGQFGLYNCELEVVKPIFALANCFGFSIDSEGYIQTPFDPKFNVTTKAYSKLFSKDNFNSRGNGDIQTAQSSASNGEINGIGNLTRKLNEIYTKVAGSTSVTAALIRIGAGVFGPVYVSEVNWEFDYSQQDEYGMPYKSKIMLNGIKPLLIEDMNGFNKSGGLNLK